MRHADSEVECHVVRVVKSGEKCEVGDVCKESECADQGPQASYAGRCRGRWGNSETGSLRGIEVKQSNDGVVEGVQYCESSREVIQLLGSRKIYAPRCIQPSRFNDQADGRSRPRV